MKVTYFAHLKNNTHRDSDEDIKDALKALGHKVYEVDDRDFEMEEIIEKTKKSDLFLFHKGGTETASDSLVDFHIALERLAMILKNVKGKKACWYQDKVYKGRENFVRAVSPMVDKIFMVDETFIRRRNYPNLYPLKQASPKRDIGEPQEKWKGDIAFIGKTYGARNMFIESMRKEFGDKFRVYMNIWGDDWYDLIRSIKIIVSPTYPMDDFYWSGRLYTTIGAQGFLIHPRFYGLKKQGFVSGKHYETYSTWDELKDKIYYYLEHPLKAEQIAKKGRKFVMENHTYQDRLKKMFKVLGMNE